MQDKPYLSCVSSNANATAPTTPAFVPKPAGTILTDSAIDLKHLLSTTFLTVSKTIFPAAATPPPIIITSGSKIATALATAIPK